MRAFQLSDPLGACQAHEKITKNDKSTSKSSRWRSFRNLIGIPNRKPANVSTDSAPAILRRDLEISINTKAKAQSPRNAHTNISSFIEQVDIGTYPYDTKLKLVSFLERGKIHSTESIDGEKYNQANLTFTSQASFFDSSYAFGAVHNKQYNILELHFHPAYRILLLQLSQFFGIDCWLGGGEAFNCLNDGNISKIYNLTKTVLLSDLSKDRGAKQCYVYGGIELLYNFLRDKDVFDGFGWESLLRNGHISRSHFEDICAWAIERDLDTVDSGFHLADQANIPTGLAPDQNPSRPIDFDVYGRTYGDPNFGRWGDIVTREELEDQAGTGLRIPNDRSLATPHPDGLCIDDKQVTIQDDEEHHKHRLRRQGGLFTVQNEEFQNVSGDDWLSLAMAFVDDNPTPSEPTNPETSIPLRWSNPEQSGDTAKTQVALSWHDGDNAKAQGNVDGAISLGSLDSSIKPDASSYGIPTSGLYQASESGFERLFANDELFSKPSGPKDEAMITSPLEDLPRITCQAEDTREKPPSESAKAKQRDCDLLPERPGPNSGPYAKNPATESQAPSKLDVDVHSHFASLYENLLQIDINEHTERPKKQRYEYLKQALPSRQIAWSVGISGIRRMIQRKAPNNIKNIICINMVEAAIINALERNPTYGNQAVLHKEIFLKNLDIWGDALHIEEEQALYNRIICQLWSRMDTINTKRNPKRTAPDIGGLFRLVTAFAISSRAQANERNSYHRGERLRDAIANFLRANSQDIPNIDPGEMEEGQADKVPKMSCLATPQNSRNVSGHHRHDGIGGSAAMIRPHALHHRNRLKPDSSWPPEPCRDEVNSQSPKNYRQKERRVSSAWVEVDSVTVTASLLNVLALFVLAHKLAGGKNRIRPIGEPLDRIPLIKSYILGPLSGFRATIDNFSDLLDDVHSRLDSHQYDDVFALVNAIICGILGFCGAQNMVEVLVGFLQHGLESYFSALTQLMCQYQGAQIFQYLGFKINALQFLYDSSEDSTMHDTLNEDLPSPATPTASSPSIRRASALSLKEPNVDSSRLVMDARNHSPADHMIESIANTPRQSLSIQPQIHSCSLQKLPLPRLTPALGKRKAEEDEPSTTAKKARRTNGGDFKCLGCEKLQIEKYFSNVHNLKRHVKEKHSAEPLKSKCENCGEKFSRNYARKHKCSKAD